ncbi:hypothetical protein RRG08_063355 [Elysia crispata]|uniref:Uncharacterized protein n=1 Tax=Elysia crispata TaxID=231223 RepID=A0AAE1B3N0_9GAST|nr:hypothetical protein RRG08_063355 [Elysia crispata]
MERAAVKDQETNTTLDLSENVADSSNAGSTTNSSSNKVNLPARNISTAPVFSRPRGLEAVLEEDEGSVSARSPLPPEPDGRGSPEDADMGTEGEDDGGGEEGGEAEGEEADDEMMDNKSSGKARKSKCRGGGEDSKFKASKADGKVKFHTINKAKSKAYKCRGRNITMSKLLRPIAEFVFYIPTKTPGVQQVCRADFGNFQVLVKAAIDTRVLLDRAIEQFDLPILIEFRIGFNASSRSVPICFKDCVRLEGTKTGRGRTYFRYNVAASCGS